MALPRATSIYFHSEIYAFSIACYRGPGKQSTHIWCKGRLHNMLYYMESNWKLPHQFIPSKTATLVPEFALEDMPLARTAALVPEFAVKDLPLGKTLDILIFFGDLLAC